MSSSLASSSSSAAQPVPNKCAYQSPRLLSKNITPADNKVVNLPKVPFCARLFGYVPRQLEGRITLLKEMISNIDQEISAEGTTAKRIGELGDGKSILTQLLKAPNDVDHPYLKNCIDPELRFRELCMSKKGQNIDTELDVKLNDKLKSNTTKIIEIQAQIQKLQQEKGKLSEENDEIGMLLLLPKNEQLRSEIAQGIKIAEGAEKLAKEREEKKLTEDKARSASSASERKETHISSNQLSAQKRTALIGAKYDSSYDDSESDLSHSRSSSSSAARHMPANGFAGFLLGAPVDRGLFPHLNSRTQSSARGQWG